MVSVDLKDKRFCVILWCHGGWFKGVFCIRDLLSVLSLSGGQLGRMQSKLPYYYLVVVGHHVAWHIRVLFFLAKQNWSDDDTGRLIDIIILIFG
jgi:hypothetical protein